MAIALIPPAGPIHDSLRRMERRQREQTSPDPVERYRLREERIQDDLAASMASLTAEAKRNHVTKSELQGDM